MVDFYYEKGHLCCRTMTVKELREALAHLPDEKAVLITWEGIHVPVSADRISIGEAGWGGQGPNDAVIINADDY